MKTPILISIYLLLHTFIFSQNVGIGISNPVFKLDVRNGSINVDSVYRIDSITVLATPGNGNLYVGKDAGKVNTGANNTFSGNLSGLSNTTGFYNSFFGYKAGTDNTNGTQNSFFGQSSGFKNTNGGNNSYYGSASGYNNTSGGFNSFFGSAAGYSNTTAFYNSFFGLAAGYYTTTGSNNSFFGESTAYYNVTGSENSFFGKNAGLNNNGSKNTAHGFSSLSTNTTGTFNTTIGYKAEVLSGVQTNSTALGALARTDCNNCMVLGSVAGVNDATSGVNVGIGTTTPLALLHVADSSVLFSAPGFAYIPAANPPISGPGRRMMWYVEKGSFRAGYVGGANWDNDSIGTYSFATGVDTKASGHNSTALGSTTTASGYYSTSLGYFTKAAGQYSTAMGGGVEARGEASTAMGVGTIAKAPGSTSIGTYNDATDNPDPVNADQADRLFQIGNGEYIARSNAVTVLRNGNIGIGTVGPLVKLHILQGSSGNITPFSPLVVEGSGNTYINLLSPDGNETGLLFGKTENAASGGIVYNNVNNTNGLQFRVNGNATKMEIYTTGNAWLAGTLTQGSDARLKTNLHSLTGSLGNLQKLNGYTYNWIDKTKDNDLQFGLLAQEVQKVYPELVKQNAAGELSVNYIGLIPVLLESVKEQQQQIENQQNQIDAFLNHDKEQQQQIDELKKLVEGLVTRN
ncbi:MAG: tail fiber domain-containing protein [Saprospiraceae bacterium]